MLFDLKELNVRNKGLNYWFLLNLIVNSLFIKLMNFNSFESLLIMFA